MEPSEWEELATRLAGELSAALDELEAEFWPEPPARTFRTFWPRVRAVNERLRLAPAIKLDDKLALQARLNQICQRARHDQKLLRDRVEGEKQEVTEALSLLCETLEEAAGVEDVQAMRQELAALRERLAAPGLALPRTDRQRLWELWQTVNQAVWKRLNDLWSDNERQLAAILCSAEERLRGGEVRAAKEEIKAFHHAVPAHQCSHRALRALKERAGTLWEEADRLGQKKHQAYLQQIGRRVDVWKMQRQRNERARRALQQEIARLEVRAGRAPTDVGAALVRGQIAERRRALARIELEDRELVRQIDEAELALARS